MSLRAMTAGSGLDTREVSLEAPAGTPAPLREAYESTARTLFLAAEMRRSPPTARGLFEIEARELASAWKTSREKYKAVELQLQAEAKGGRCAHQDALNEICRVNDCCGHVIQSIIPFDHVTEYLQATPGIDLAKLLRRMRRQTSRATLRIQRTDRDTHSSNKSETSKESKSDRPRERNRSKTVRDPKLEARDRWIYRRCYRGDAYKEIIAELSEFAPKRNWRKITTIQGIRSAAMDYAERTGSPKLPSRQNL